MYKLNYATFTHIVKEHSHSCNTQLVSIQLCTHKLWLWRQVGLTHGCAAPEVFRFISNVAGYRSKRPAGERSTRPDVMWMFHTATLPGGGGGGGGGGCFPSAC